MCGATGSYFIKHPSMIWPAILARFTRAFILDAEYLTKAQTYG